MEKCFIFALMILLTACGGNKKRLLTLESENTVIPEVIASQYESETVLDSISPKRGIQSQGVRKEDPANPPVRLNIAGAVTGGSFDIGNFYSNAEYIKLKHPVTDAGFVNGATFTLNFETGRYMRTPVNSEAYFTGDHIIAGDMVYGLYAYDMSGKFQYTVWSPKTLGAYSETRMSYNLAGKDTYLGNVIVNGNDCLISLNANSNLDNRLELHNIAEKSVISRPVYTFPGRLMLVDSRSFMEIRYGQGTRQGANYLYSFDFSSGDTISGFGNYNPAFQQAPPQTYYPWHEDNGLTKYYNGEVTFRQSYNDTVYRVRSLRELAPAYVFDLGSSKLDVGSELYAAAVGKLMPSGWLETEKFVLFSLSKGKENAGDKTQYSYYLYNKEGGKLSRVGDDKAFEMLKAGNDNIIPMSYGRTSSLNNTLFTSFTKAQLKEIMDDGSFSSLSQKQQSKVKSLYDDMNAKELIVMIVK